MKNKECCKCGCDRNLLIKDAVFINQNDGIQIKLKTFCVPCFLEILGLTAQAKFKNLEQKYLSCKEKS